MSVRVDALEHAYGEVQTLAGLTLSFPPRSITAILGPSGCGKTTLLRLLAGLEEPRSGLITGIDRRRVSMLFQEPRLLPWESCLENVELVLHELASVERRAHAQHMLELVGLEGALRSVPGTLSGGMKQRVALARAFAYPSDVVLMDEPFQSLDIALKLDLLSAFEGLWQSEPRIAVCVTHDVHEAVFLGDRIAVLSDRPADVIRTVENPIPRGEREFGRPEVVRMEHQLYRELLEAT